MEKLLAVYMERLKTIHGNGAVDHIRWMLTEIPKFKDPLKQQRWLGFVQGSCWLMQIFTIDEMRAHVRDHLQIENETSTINRLDTPAGGLPPAGN